MSIFVCAATAIAFLTVVFHAVEPQTADFPVIFVAEMLFLLPNYYSM